VQRYRTAIKTISRGATAWSRRGINSEQEWLISWKQEVGTPVFIVRRRIAAIRAAGTAYE
jgi:hypothetical protein